VVSVGTFQAGIASNVIPESVVMELSVRAMKPEIRDLLIKRIHELADFTAKSYGASSVVEVYDSYPVLTNSPEETDFARALALEVFGREGVLESVSPMNASEDFAFMLRERPGATSCSATARKGRRAVAWCTTPATTLTMTLSPPARRCSPAWWKSTVANLWRRTRMKKSLLLWLALMASTSALAEGERRSASASTRLSRRLNGKIRRASWRGLISI
jgi:hypothetical protein